MKVQMEPIYLSTIFPKNSQTQIYIKLFNRLGLLCQPKCSLTNKQIYQNVLVSSKNAECTGEWVGNLGIWLNQPQRWFPSKNRAYMYVFLSKNRVKIWNFRVFYFTSEYDEDWAPVDERPAPEALEGCSRNPVMTPPSRLTVAEEDLKFRFLWARAASQVWFGCHSA